MHEVVAVGTEGEARGGGEESEVVEGFVEGGVFGGEVGAAGWVAG